jgi:NADH:ubiquinone oxidoreductase subunit H
MKMGFLLNTYVSLLLLEGYNYPGMSWAVENWGVNLANVLGIVALFIKICGFIFLYMWVRWTKFRYDQLMHLGWRVLIPIYRQYHHNRCNFESRNSNLLRILNSTYKCLA